MKLIEKSVWAAMGIIAIYVYFPYVVVGLMSAGVYYLWSALGKTTNCGTPRHNKCRWRR